MKTPLIVLSASAGEMDKVQLLEIGADDYMVKPFGVRELLARIRAVLRRASSEDSKVLEFGQVEVDLTRRVVRRAGRELKLTRAEYNLLTYFLQNPDRVLTRDVILNSVWGYDYFPHTRTVDAHVVRLTSEAGARKQPSPAIFLQFTALDTGSCHRHNCFKNRQLFFPAHDKQGVRRDFMISSVTSNSQIAQAHQTQQQQNVQAQKPSQKAPQDSVVLEQAGFRSRRRRPRR